MGKLFKMQPRLPRGKVVFEEIERNDRFECCIVLALWQLAGEKPCPIEQSAFEVSWPASGLNLNIDHATGVIFGNKVNDRELFAVVVCRELARLKFQLMDQGEADCLEMGIDQTGEERQPFGFAKNVQENAVVCEWRIRNSYLLAV